MNASRLLMISGAVLAVLGLAAFVTVYRHLSVLAAVPVVDRNPPALSVTVASEGLQFITLIVGGMLSCLAVLAGLAVLVAGWLKARSSRI